MCVTRFYEVLKVALLISCLGTLGPTRATESETVECSKLGFSGLGLCSDCDSLAKFVNDAELEKDCRACCVSGDDVDTYTQAATATLTVCPRRIMYYPVVNRFFDEELKNFPGLDRKWKSNVTPTLVMKDEEGNVLESVDISRWQLKHIKEFLEAKLQPAKATTK